MDNAIRETGAEFGELVQFVMPVEASWENCRIINDVCLAVIITIVVVAGAFVMCSFFAVPLFGAALLLAVPVGVKIALLAVAAAIVVIAILHLSFNRKVYIDNERLTQEANNNQTDLLNVTNRLGAEQREVASQQTALQDLRRDLREARLEIDAQQRALEQATIDLRHVQQASRAIVAAMQARNSRAGAALWPSSLAQSSLVQPPLVQPSLARSALGRSTLGQSVLRASTLAQSQLPAVAVARADESNAMAQSIVQFALTAPEMGDEMLLEALEQLAQEQAVENQLESQPPEQTAIWAGRALSALRKVGGAMMTGLKATVDQAHLMGQFIAGAVNANIEHDHPWKQKKYETAIKEFKQRFLDLCPAQIDLRNFETELGKEVSRLLVHLYVAATGAEVDYRCSFYQLVVALRAVITSDAYTALAATQQRSAEGNALIAIVRLLCYCRYAEVHLFAFCEKLVADVIAAGSEQAPSQTISMADFEAIAKAPVQWKGTDIGKNIGKIKGHTNINFDPSLYCNVPFVLGDMPIGYIDGSNKIVRFLRMGVPTIQSLGDWDNIRNDWEFVGTEVDPIWRELMQAQREAGKSHLYVSYQNDIPGFVLNGDESRRNQALKDLAAMNPAFIFVVLAQDSPFYHQKGAFSADEIERQVFIEQFMGQLMGDSVKTGFYFPAAWKEADSSFAVDVRYLLRGLLEVLYPASGGRDTLHKAQRKDAIEIFEACLFLHMVVKTRVDTANGTCKDAIDRAMKSFAILLELFMIVQGVDTSEARKIQKTYAHAPAFMVKKQAMVRDRRDRLLSALDALQVSSARKRMAAWLQVNRALFGIQRGDAFAVTKKQGQIYHS